MAVIRQTFRRAWAFLRKFYDKHTIRRIVLTLLAAVALAYVAVSIPVWTLKNQSMEKTISRQPLEGQPIEKEAGKIQVAESGGRQLWVDTATMVAEVKDEKGNVLYSTAAKGSAGTELALFSLAYLGEDNNLYEWNSYDNSALLSSYELYQIDGGVRFDVNLNEGESNRFYEYMPKKMSSEVFEQTFQGGDKGAGGRWNLG